MKTISIKIYKFQELNENIQENIINNYIEYLISTTDFEKINKNSNLYKAFNTCQKMQTPWFLGQYVWNYCKKQILKNVKESEYYSNGIPYINII